MPAAGILSPSTSVPAAAKFAARSYKTYYYCDNKVCNVCQQVANPKRKPNPKPCLVSNLEKMLKKVSSKRDSNLSVRRQACYQHSHWGFAGNDVFDPPLTHCSYLAAAGTLVVGIECRLIEQAIKLIRERTWRHHHQLMSRSSVVPLPMTTHPSAAESLVVASQSSTWDQVPHSTLRRSLSSLLAGRTDTLRWFPITINQSIDQLINPSMIEQIKN